MLPSYKDITDKLGEPIWFDKHGVPRYCEFHPSRVGVYARLVLYFKIGCQSCDAKWKVAVDHSKASLQGYRLMENSVDIFHYGDPPIYGHDADCSAGATMNSVPIQVISLWKFSDMAANWEWIEQKEHRGMSLWPDWMKEE